jgi:hypothetical protein
MSPRSLVAAVLTGLAATLVALVPGAAHADPAAAPTVPTQYFSTTYGTTLTGNLCAGATDPQGGPIAVESVAATDVALTYVNSTCAFTLKPGTWEGPLTISYRLTDGVNVSNPQKIVVTVGRQGNAAVVAQTESFATGKGLRLIFPNLQGQLTANDLDPEGAPITTLNQTMPENGAFLPGEAFLGARQFGTTAWLYTPPTGFVGTRRFTYLASDGVNTTQQVYTITMTDHGPQQLPVAKPDAYDAPKGGSLTTTKANGLLANDADADSAYILVNGHTDPAHGTLTAFDNYTGAFTYTPQPGYVGPDSFTYRVTDSEGNETPFATVSLTVRSLPPVAVDDAVQVAQDAATVIPFSALTANDSDPDSSYAVVSVLGGGHGTALANYAAKTLTYTPSPGYTGPDAIIYRLRDPDGNDSGWANVAVTVVPTGVNQAPVANADGYQVHQGKPLTVSAAQGPLANDTDFEKQALQIASHGTPQHGAFTAFDEATGAFTYQPQAGWHGTETIGYTVKDPQNAVSGSATITIEVVNDAPVAADDAYDAVPGAPLHISAAEGVLANDTDPEGLPLQATDWGFPSHGILVHDNDGSLVYTPDADFTGVDTVVYAVRDDAWQKSNYATVTFTVATGELVPATPTLPAAAQVGRPLVAEPGAWGPGTVSLGFRWLRDGTAIDGATAASYTPGPGDLGHRLSVRVTGTRTGYASAERTSAEVVVGVGTLSAPTPRVTGKARAGRRLRAVAGTWAPAPVTLTYQWLRNGKAIKGATGTSYRVGRKDRGKRIAVRVTGSRPGFATAVRVSAPKRVR